MPPPRSDFCELACRCIRLTFGVASPAGGGAVGSDSARVLSTCGDVSELACRCIRLARKVASQQVAVPLSRMAQE